MFHIALYEPEIPPNTGNIMRLCANTGCRLHLIHPLGFEMDTKKLKRAGMDYRDQAVVEEHDTLAALLEKVKPSRILAITTKGSQPYHHIDYRPDDLILFGPETRGLPDELLTSLPAAQRLRIPMLRDSRSMNLSNSVAVIAYEALKQNNFSEFIVWNYCIKFM